MQNNMNIKAVAFLQKILDQINYLYISPRVILETKVTFKNSPQTLKKNFLEFFFYENQQNRFFLFFS